MASAPPPANIPGLEVSFRKCDRINRHTLEVVSFGAYVFSISCKSREDGLAILQFATRETERLMKTPLPKDGDSDSNKRREDLLASLMKTTAFNLGADSD
jgi:hypothetical protein